MPSFKELYSPRSLFVIVSAALLLVVLYYTQIHWSQQEIAQYIQQFGPLGVIVYVLLVIAFNVAAPLSASPILLLGFSLFQQWAIWLFALGNFIAMAINFWLARKYGRSLIQRIIGIESMAKVDEVSANYGLLALFMTRLFLSGLSDIASYAFGLTQIRFKPYIIVSVIASLPPYILFTLLSSRDQTSVQFLLLQLVIAGALSGTYLLGRVVVKRFLRLLIKGY